MQQLSIDEGESKFKYYLLLNTSHRTTESTTAKPTKPTNPTKSKIIMSSSYSYREIEHSSLAACTNNNIQTNKTIHVQLDESTKQWTTTTSTSTKNSSTIEPTPITNLSPGTTIRISPMSYHHGGWSDDVHFHSQFKLPPSSNISKGIIITLQAKAKECIAIALSPQPNFILGKTYAIHIGAMNNLQTVIRRRLGNQQDAVDVCIPSPKVCSESMYKSYWIVLQGNGQLSVGLGDNVGVDCIGTLDDSMYHALRSGVDAVRYVGLGNSALGRKARDLKVRNVKIMSIPSCFGNSIVPLVAYDPSKVNYDNGNNIGGGGGGGGEGDGKEDNLLWMEYQKECEKAKKRAIKFGIEYRQPPPDAFFKWSEARRMRANHDRGFITGMDIMSTEEKVKAGKRKERFEAEEKRNRELGLIGDTQNVDNVTANENNYNDGDDDVMQDENNNDDDDDTNANQQQTRKERDPLPIEQAWDNIDLVENFRVDPPPEDQIILNDNGQSNTNSMLKDDSDDAAATTTNVALVPEKIHLFAIDWAAFKQIRTDDIMGYFSLYGPSYVEWLGELSCNVLFGDKYSAARAMEGMSRALPDEVPTSLFEKKTVEESKDDNAMGVDDKEDNINNDNETAIDKSMNEDNGDESGTTTMMEDNDNVPSNNAEMDQDSTTQGNKNENDNDDCNNKTINTSKLTNLGKMGWRFCNHPIRKRQDDRYGRRGTRSRILMRVANSLDVLEERPTSWPKPPPGFSTKVSGYLTLHYFRLSIFDRCLIIKHVACYKLLLLFLAYSWTRK